MPNRESRFNSRTLQAWSAFGVTPMLQVIAATTDAPAEILLYDEIGQWGITAKDFTGALAKAGAGPVVVRINSPGGDVFDGLAIHNALKAHAGGVTTIVDGLAASAASYIAMAGAPLRMAESSMMMIHNSATYVIGNRHYLTQTAATLGKIDGQLAGIYAARTGKTADDIGALMDAETWFTASEAKDAGFADEVTKGAAPPNPARAQAAADWTCGAATNLPLANAGAWDGPAAADRMLKEAGFDGDTPDIGKAKRGFLAYDAGAPKLKGSYKLPFADIIGGELKAVVSGIDAAASRLPDTDIPQAVIDKAQGVLDGYEKRAKQAHLVRKLRNVLARE